MRAQDHDGAFEPIEPLTNREREILSFLAQGYSGPEIAERLTLAVSTVKWYIQQLYGKLGVNGKRRAIQRAAELGILAASATGSPPGLPAPPRPRHNLPAQVTRCFGREAEIAELEAQFAENRLVTLVGAGGSGKTRLAQQFAEKTVSEYPDGVWLVELAPLDSPELVPQRVARCLGLREEPTVPAVRMVANFLGSRRMLILLDNCEHLLDACAQLVSTLLQACAGLKVLATSRERLGVAGEAVFVVPSLATPAPADKITVESLSHYAALGLLVDRARLASPGFQVTPANVTALARICQSLDGMPLAIELAAARLRLLSPQALADRLGNMLPLLTGGSRAAPQRQQTLRATLDWSYDLLTDAQRAWLRCLAVFAGGWSLEAADTLATRLNHTTANSLDRLADLEDKSLIVVEHRPDRDARYRMLEPIRQYAQEKLQAADNAARIRTAHLELFLGLAERAEPELSGDRQIAWFERLEAEHDNFRASLAWSLQDGQHLLSGLRLAAALGYFWAVRGYNHEGRLWLDRVLAAVDERHDRPDEESTTRAAYAKALVQAGQLAIFQADYGAARDRFDKSLAIAQELGDVPGTADALEGLGDVHMALEDYAAARACHLRSLSLRRRTGPDTALARSIRDLAEVSLYEGRLEECGRLVNESLALCRAAGDRRGLALTLMTQGWLHASTGSLPEARTSFTEALKVNHQLGFTRRIARCLAELGNLAVTTEDWERATLFLSMAGALIQATGSGFPELFQIKLEQALAEARATLHPDLFAELSEQARAMAAAEMVKFALDDHPSAGAKNSSAGR
jgi:non-specific serine/threonine protein kinase